MLRGHILLRWEKLLVWCRAGLHMTAETLGASQVRAIQHADGKHQTRHDEFLHELAQVCASSEWLKCYMGRLWLRRFLQTTMILQMLLTGNLSSTITTLAPTQATESWVLSTLDSSAKQRKRRQEAKASSKWACLMLTAYICTKVRCAIIWHLNMCWVATRNTIWRPAMRQLTCQEAYIFLHLMHECAPCFTSCYPVKEESHSTYIHGQTIWTNHP